MTENAKKYDYLTGRVEDDKPPLSVLIQLRANEGWRLISCQHIESNVYFLIMEREQRAGSWSLVSRWDPTDETQINRNGEQ